MEEQINSYFEERIAACQAAAAALNADNRADEAVFEKIRMNVYDIFRTVYSAGTRACGNDPQKRVAFLLARLQEIPANWQTSLEAAQRHGNTEKAHIEWIKLEVVAEIKQNVQKWSDET